MWQKKQKQSPTPPILYSAKLSEGLVLVIMVILKLIQGISLHYRDKIKMPAV